MNTQQLRESTEYTEACRKINSYRKGFRFTIPYYKMTTGQKNAMRIIISDCEKQGLIRSVAMGISLGLDITEETFERI